MGCKKHEEIPVGKSDIAFNRVWMHGWSHPINRYRRHEEDAKFCRTSLRKEDTCKSNASTAVNGRWKLQLFLLLLFVHLFRLPAWFSFCLSVCLLVCLSVYLSVCIFVSVCVFLRLSNPPSYSLANDFTDREHVSIKYLTIPISTVAILLMEFLKSASGNGCQYKLS